MNGTDQPPPGESLAERLARAERRLARLEDYLQLEPEGAAAEPPQGASSRSEDELEFVVGQSWFATVGILVLLVGVLFTLSLPYPNLPTGAPSLIGFGVSAAIFLLARGSRGAFAVVSGNLRGAAMALLYFSALRLCFFGGRPALSAASPAGSALLVAVVGLNLGFALHRRSPWLAALALAMGYATALVVGSAWFVLVAVTLLAAIAVLAARRCGWPGFTLLGIALTYLTYLLWAIGNPLLGHSFFVTVGPIASLAFLLVCAVILAAGSWGRRHGEQEDMLANLSAFFNCAGGYGLFLLHSVASFAPVIVKAQAAASLVFLAIAVAFWVRERSRVATFVYAMTGYVALSVAIVGAAKVPQVFIWLSLQSLVVVATAIWFQSRLIVVANFLIYAGIVIAYMAIARVETGISVAFGLVALATARLLHWQRDRLELKTELMRNAYLISALVVFPYALYHLVDRAYVGLAWTAVALLYYGMNLVVRSRKYRWMGHATLLFTAFYLMLVGINRLEPLYRNLSFFVLGAVFLIVSIIFTKLRARRASMTRTEAGEGVSLK